MLRALRSWLLGACLLGASGFTYTPAVNVLSVKAYGAVGDGKADDTAALQAALDAAGTLKRALYVPAGTYLVNRTLVVRVDRSMSIIGEGMYRTTIQLNTTTPQVAVLTFVSSAPSANSSGHGTEQHDLTGLNFDAHGANFSVYAPALTYSRFNSVTFQGAHLAGIYFGYGWVNTFDGCLFKYNKRFGLWAYFGVNMVNILNSNFASNGASGIFVDQGKLVRIEGNTLEGHGGPAIIANAMSSLSVRANFFESNSISDGGPLKFVDATGAAVDAPCADILLDSAGDVSPFAPATFSGIITLGSKRPCMSVTAAANYHGVGAKCADYAAVSAWGARGLVVESNSGIYCGRALASQTCAWLDPHGMSSRGANVRLELNTDYGPVPWL